MRSETKASRLLSAPLRNGQRLRRGVGECRAIGQGAIPEKATAAGGGPEPSVRKWLRDACFQRPTFRRT